MVISRTEYISSIVLAILWGALLAFNVVVVFIGITNGGSLWGLNALIGVWSAFNVFRFGKTIYRYREQINANG